VAVRKKKNKPKKIIQIIIKEQKKTFNIFWWRVREGR